jgi:anti-anti-sigma factor
VADPYYTVAVQWVAAAGDVPATAVLRLGGDLDINARDELCDTMAATARDPRCHRLVVDLSDTAFLDSEAMNALINGFAAASDSGVGVRLAGARGMVRRVLAVSGVFELVETLDSDARPGGAAAGPPVLPFPPRPLPADQ